VVLLRRWLKAHWLSVVAHVGALVPLGQLGAGVFGGFRLDPVGQATALTGRAALALLLLSLSCTPLAIITGYRAVMRVRRALGLYAFLYAGLHLLVFVGWDYRFAWRLLGPALVGQRFIVAGLVAFLILLPLALTSTRGWQRRLGAGWRWLHRAVYAAAVLAALHLIWLKKDWSEALGPTLGLALLLALRLPPVRAAVENARARLSGHRGRIPETLADTEGADARGEQ